MEWIVNRRLSLLVRFMYIWWNSWGKRWAMWSRIIQTLCMKILWFSRIWYWRNGRK